MILLFVISISVISCNKQKADISKFSWLTGKWEGDYNGMTTFEEWQPLKENTMPGRGGVMSGTDTMFAGTIYRSTIIRADRLRKVELRFGDSSYAYRYINGYVGVN